MPPGLLAKEALVRRISTNRLQAFANSERGMEADDLLCSRNARPQMEGWVAWPSSCSRNAHDRNVLVRRAQSRIDQATLENEMKNWEDMRSRSSSPHPLRNNERAWRKYLCRSRRGIGGSPGLPVKKYTVPLRNLQANFRANGLVFGGKVNVIDRASHLAALDHVHGLSAQTSCLISQIRDSADQ
jgi:hypothetical protein